MYTSVIYAWTINVYQKIFFFLEWQVSRWFCRVVNKTAKRKKKLYIHIYCWEDENKKTWDGGREWWSSRITGDREPKQFPPLYRQCGDTQRWRYICRTLSRRIAVLTGKARMRILFSFFGRALLFIMTILLIPTMIVIFSSTITTNLDVERTIIFSLLAHWHGARGKKNEVKKNGKKNMSRIIHRERQRISDGGQVCRGPECLTHRRSCENSSDDVQCLSCIHSRCIWRNKIETWKRYIFCAQRAVRGERVPNTVLYIYTGNAYGLFERVRNWTGSVGHLEERISASWELGHSQADVRRQRRRECTNAAQRSSRLGW